MDEINTLKVEVYNLMASLQQHQLLIEQKNARIAELQSTSEQAEAPAQGAPKEEPKKDVSTPPAPPQ